RLDPDRRGDPRPAAARADERPADPAAGAHGAPHPRAGGGAARHVHAGSGHTAHRGRGQGRAGLPALAHRVRVLAHQPQPEQAARLQGRGHPAEGRLPGGAEQPALAGHAAVLGREDHAVPRRGGSGRCAGDAPVAQRRPAAGEVRPPVSQVITSDGTRLNVEIRETRSAPTVTVVLVHGWTQDLRTWDHVVTGLARRSGSMRLVRYDLRGHGDSEPAAPGTATIERLADDLAEVIAETAPSGPLVL